jgi:predicted dehydrogenase
VGVVGAGAVAQVAHLPVLARTEDVSIVGICDNDGPKARSLAARFEVSDVYEDIEELLEYTKPEAVLICTPNHLHEVHVKAALRAGAHVLCERPLGLTTAAVRGLIEAGTQSGKALVVGMNHRFRRDVQVLRMFFEGGELGNIQALRGGWYVFRPARQALGWRSYHQQSGGGAMFDLGLGLIDLSLWLVTEAKPRHVTASFDSNWIGAGSVEDAGCALVVCEGGTSVFVDVSWRYVGQAERYWFGVTGSQGSAQIGPLTVFKELHGSAVDVTPTGALSREGEFSASYHAEWAHFLAIVRGNIEQPDLSDQLDLHRVMEAIYRSAAEGRSVEV